MRRFALCPTTAHRAELGINPVFWAVERTMANPAQEARARLEARFRKQYEAEQTAGKDRAERDADVGRESYKEPKRSSSADQTGGQRGRWG